MILTPDNDDLVRRIVESLREAGAKEILTLSDCAKHARRHRQTVWRAIRNGSLNAFQSQGRWRILLPDLAAWIGSSA